MSEFDDLFDEWLTQTIGHKPLLGSSAEGVQFGALANIDDIGVEHARRLVRDSDGREVVSETTLYVPADKPTMKPGDEIVIGARTSTVIRVADFAPFGLFDHRVVNLT